MAGIQSRSLNWSPSVPAWRQMEVWRQKQAARTENAISNISVLGDALGAAMVNQTAGTGELMSKIAIERLQTKPDTKAAVDKLRAYVAVVEAGGYTAASKKLGKRESELKTQVEQLESQVGRPIFVRGASTMKLTLDGQKLMVYAREMIRRDALAENG